MAICSVAQLAFAFGLLGNIVSFTVYLSPLPTFYKIYKKKSTEGFQALPYSVALFSASLTLYYGLLKTNGFMLVTINAIGCAIEGTYLIIYLIFAPKGSKISTAKMLMIFNIVALGTVVLFTSRSSEGSKRITVVGWICAVFSVCVYAAPLSIMWRVIKTKSVEYMPFLLSFFLTLCATIWFFYGLLVKDYFIALPNTLGFLFGIAQMILYLVYKNAKKPILPEQAVQELKNSEISSKPKMQEDHEKHPEAAAIQECVTTTALSEPSELNV